MSSPTSSALSKGAIERCVVRINVVAFIDTLFSLEYQLAITVTVVVVARN